jgi:hypothetical protein
MTESEMNQHMLLASNSRDILLYPATASSVPAGMVTVATPITVINRGTPQYKEDIHGVLVASINISSLITKYVLPILRSRDQDERRGNTQITFGIACSKNVGVVPEQPARPTPGVNNFGVTYPRILTNTTDPEVMNALKLGWKIGKLAKIAFCQDDFLKKNQNTRITSNSLKKPWVNPTCGLACPCVACPLWMERR